MRPSQGQNLLEAGSYSSIKMPHISIFLLHYLSPLIPAASSLLLLCWNGDTAGGAQGVPQVPVPAWRAGGMAGALLWLQCSAQNGIAFGSCCLWNYGKVPRDL